MENMSVLNYAELEVVSQAYIHDAQRKMCKVISCIQICTGSWGGSRTQERMVSQLGVLVLRIFMESSKVHKARFY